jgi:hypothetical protein
VKKPILGVSELGAMCAIERVGQTGCIADAGSRVIAVEASYRTIEAVQGGDREASAIATLAADSRPISSAPLRPSSIARIKMGAKQFVGAHRRRDDLDRIILPECPPRRGFDRARLLRESLEYSTLLFTRIVSMPSSSPRLTRWRVRMDPTRPSS